MDLSDTIAPKSDQLDAVDLLSGPRTFTIERVSRNNDEQPINIHLTGFPRPWRPGLSMRRVLVSCWGKDAATYVGRRVTLYCDPDVQFGGAAVGGTRIAALSHIDKPKQVPLLIKRGKSAIFVVKPLADEPPPTSDNGGARKLYAALRDNGLGSKEAGLAYLTDLLGREITTTADLSEDEVARAIADLERGDAHVDAAEPTLPGADQ